MGVKVRIGRAGYSDGPGSLAHLRESTRLKYRRDADDVAGGVDEVTQRLVVGECERSVFTA